MKKKFFILFGLITVFSTILFLWWSQATKPLDPTKTTTVTFRVKRGEFVRDIAEKLERQNLIRSSVAFFLLTRFSGVASRIQAGEFRLSPSMSLSDITSSLTHGTMDVEITIPEGWRNEEIAAKLSKKIDIPESEFLKRAREGYMFPDTYLFPKDATAAVIVNIFLTNFNKKMAQNNIKKEKLKSLSLHQLITIASMVEREAKFPEDRPLVASVILNRLKIGMKLDIDATVQYVLGYQPKEKTWWKKNLTSKDLEIDSPYNTYKANGLPPAPITNPGLAAVKAVIEAPDTDYLYYLSDKSGKTHFSKSADEHNIKINKYLK